MLNWHVRNWWLSVPSAAEHFGHKGDTSGENLIYTNYFGKMDCEKLLAFTDQLWILSRHGSPSQDCLNQWFYRPAYPNMYAEVSAQNVKCVLSKNVLFVDNGEKKDVRNLYLCWSCRKDVSRSLINVGCPWSIQPCIWKIQLERCNTLKTAAAMGNRWLAASSQQCARPCILCRVFRWNIKSPRWLSPHTARIWRPVTSGFSQC